MPHFVTPCLYLVLDRILPRAYKPRDLAMEQGMDQITVTTLPPDPKEKETKTPGEGKDA